MGNNCEEKIQNTVRGLPHYCYSVNNSNNNMRSTNMANIAMVGRRNLRRVFDASTILGIILVAILIAIAVIAWTWF